MLSDPKLPSTVQRVKEKENVREKTPNLFRLREKLLFQEYPTELLSTQKECVIGLPRVLFFWDTMPFWSTFFRSLGFQVRFSDSSTRAMYECGLGAVTSDTVCFPAKLVHGHLRNLVAKRVDYIFLPSITEIPPENNVSTSCYTCAVVKGYPLVVHNSDNVAQWSKTKLETPLFHWRTIQDRERQLTDYMNKAFHIPIQEIKAAISYGDKAMASFRRLLQDAGQKVIEQARISGTFAVVLASRPYQNDALVNHGLPEMFTAQGVSVLTVDSLPDLNQVDLGRSAVEIANNYHARMLSAAILAAQKKELEYVQIVSFGCGHDAYLSDEVVRLMREISGKAPLILKLDESDNQGPLRIRVRSFLETLTLHKKAGESYSVRELPEPYPVKFTAEDKRQRVVLIPNTSHAFSRVMAAAFATQGLKTVSLEYGREDAIRYGKQYVHNDICFPAQMVIGEALAALKSGQYDPDRTAIGMGKYVGDCRLTHYSYLLRKALDDAGFPKFLSLQMMTKTLIESIRVLR